MLLIFDIDGTLTDTGYVETVCYADAFRTVTGHDIKSTDWSKYTEATAKAIVRDYLEDQGCADLDAMEERLRAAFVERLKAEHRVHPEHFRPTPGALRLFNRLKAGGDHTIAIATGCWRESAGLKLAFSGYDAGSVPFASSSDARRRKDIIALAAERAGMPLTQAVYVGDGVWDMNATAELGIPFIGVGKRHALLKEKGARYTLATLENEALFNRYLQACAG